MRVFRLALFSKVAVVISKSQGLAHMWATDLVIVSLNGVSNAVPRRGFGRTVETWKTPLDGASRTQAGSLCYIVPRSVERSLEMLPDGTSARPQRRRDDVM